MKALDRFLFPGEYLPLDLKQEFAGQAVVKAFGDRHAVQNTVNKEVDALIVELISDVFELGDFVLLPLRNYCCLMLLKAVTE